MPRISNAARYRKVELFGRWTCRDSTDKVTPSGRVANASRTSHTRSTARNGYNAPSRDLGDVIGGSLLRGRPLSTGAGMPKVVWRRPSPGWGVAPQRAYA